MHPFRGLFMPRCLTLFLRALAVLLALGLPAQAAEEVISRYRSDIVVEPDGTLDVTETISVLATGERIRHGIFRDFPLTMVDAKGRKGEVGFTLLGVTRDGADEPYHTEYVSNGIRIYAGQASIEVSPGPHVYEFHYRSDRQIRYFADHDELYWNVTGNGWQFPILSAVAHVTLPAPVTEKGIAFFTGIAGSTATDAAVTALSGNEVTIAAKNRLEPGEGLTIVIAQPKGAIAAPSTRQNLWWQIRDNLAAIIGWVGFLALFGFYYKTWDKIGRDPPKGVIVPRWDPPGKLSPALINLVDNKGSISGFTALSASALSLAVKGLLTIEDFAGSLTLHRTEKTPREILPQGEDVLYEAVLAKGFFTIDKANGERVQSLSGQFNSAVLRGNSGKFYNANGGVVFAGIVATAAVAGAALYFGHLDQDTLGVGITMAVSCAIIGVAVMTLLRGGFSRGSLLARVFRVIGIGGLAFGAVTVLLGSFGSTIAGSSSNAGPVVLGAAALVLLNVVFAFLMGAPTRLGRELMDGIEGFRTYLTLAEADRMNMAGAPRMSPSHFETLLPYAVALGVEKPWSNAFQTWLSSAAAAGTASTYHPGWYSGSRFDADHFSSFTSSFASTIASTIPQPKSSDSSGFSGGSSGGGGGGGGGGGW